MLGKGRSWLWCARSCGSLLIPLMVWLCGSDAEAQQPNRERFGGNQTLVRQPQARPQSNPQPPSRTRITRDNPSSAARDASRAPDGEVPSVWLTFGALMIVVLLILGIAAIWRRHGPALAVGIPPEAVHVLGKRSIDQRQSIYLVRLGSRLLLLGSSAQGLQTLAEVTDPVEVDLLAGMCKRSDGDHGMVQAFAQLFSRSSSTPSAPSRTPSRPQPEPFAQERFPLPAAAVPSPDREELRG